MLFWREKTAWPHRAVIFDAPQERKRAVQLAFVPIICLQRQVVALVTRMILRLKTRVLLMGAKWWA